MKSNKKTKYIVFPAITILMSLVYTGHLLFSDKNNLNLSNKDKNTYIAYPANSINPSTANITANTEGKHYSDKIGTMESENNNKDGDNINTLQYILHEAFNEEIGGYIQKINLITIKPDSRVSVKPALSHGSIFGFEKLKSIAERYGAYGAVNGGFFYEYGQPAGLVVIDGRIISGTEGKYPVFLYNGKSARLEQKELKLWIECGENKIILDNINTLGLPGKAIVYTRDFAPDNRADISNISIVIKDNKITDVIKTEGKTEIPKEGMVVTLYEPLDESINIDWLKPGSDAVFKSFPEFSANDSAYECGSWIVRNNQIVAPERDEWVGILTTKDPRTAVGIKDNGDVVFITVDGRQPGYSMGVTARELGEYLMAQGVSNAAMLDGGASTEMIINGITVNRPSNNGEGRPLGGGIIINIIDS